jgi:ABC-2 type transport system permease protein
MKSIIKWTLWQRRWSIMWWSLGISSYVLLNLVFYPTLRDQAGELQKTFENLPSAATQLFGGNDFFSPIGYLTSKVFFLMLPLLLGMLAISLGSTLLAREEQDHTIDSLLARPVPRSSLLLAKSFAGVIIVCIVALIVLITTLIEAQLIHLGISILAITEAMFACLLMVISFGAIALLFTALGRARTASLGLASAIAFGGYLISSFSASITWLDTPSKLFPFHYYQPEAILRGTFDWSNLGFFAGVIIVCGIVSWFAFRKRDIY